MRATRVMFFLVIALMLAIAAGCKGKEDVGPEKTPFIGGKNGLRMSFMPGAPPDEIFDNGQAPFGIVVKLDNAGEDDVEAADGYVEIIGINPRDYNKQNQADFRKNFPSKIDRAKKTSEGKTIEGGSITVDFSDLNYMADLAGNKMAKIRANLCYDYKTRATSLICIKKDLLRGLQTKEICEVSGDKKIANSGGPIQIKSISQAPMGNDKIQLMLEIANMGEANDMFFKKGTECDDMPTNVERFKVFLKITSDVDGVKPQCTGLTGGADASEGYVTLYNKESRKVVCTMDVAGVESIYEDSFDAELEYRYSQFIEKPILVKDVSGDSG